MDHKHLLFNQIFLNRFQVLNETLMAVFEIIIIEKKSLIVYKNHYGNHFH